jgi:glycosyltransferase involved in cell wall biosynthesis
MIEMSESDFYDVVDLNTIHKEEKKYDFIYSCLRDVDNDNDPNPCPKDGWNAINRNFNLAQSCLPIMIQEFGYKVLIVGRVNCGLEEKYGDRLEIVDMLPYHDFQQRIRQSRYLFVPNIYDASPRVIAEAMVNDVPVLMNRSIVCGSKYINDRTGIFFTDEHDIRYSLRKMKEKKYEPRQWWSENYSVKKAGVKLRNFLAKAYPEKLRRVKEVYFH